MKRTLGLLLSLCLPLAAEPSPEFEARLPQLESAIRTQLVQSGVPGASVAIVHRGRVLFLKGFGVRQVGRPELVDADTVFQLASCSKPMTSTAVASLVSKQILSWDDPVTRYLPEYRLSDDWVSEHVSIRDMLCHRSGLPGFAGDLPELLGVDRTQILHKLRYLPAAYPFRAGYAYTNFGYTTGGEAAARAAGLPFEDMMDREVFRPLGMTSSSARFSDFSRHPNHAHTHQMQDGKAEATVRNPDPQSPAGGVSSSAKDMIRWAQFHLDRGSYQGKQLIASADLEETHKIHAVTSNNPGDFSARGYYGLGWALNFDEQGRYRVTHAGAFSAGAHTVVTLWPQEQLGVVVLSNAFPSGLPQGVVAGVLKLYDTGQLDPELMRRTEQTVATQMSAMLASELPPLAAPRTAAQPLSSYLGRYASDYLGPATVVQSGEGLSLQLGKARFQLEHQTRDTFLATAAGLDSFRVNFIFDGTGAATGFRQEGLSPVDTPYFERTP